MAKQINFLPNGVSFGSRNIMTPKWEGYYQLPDGAVVELSSGRGLSGGGLWGVTVKPANGRSRPFQDERAARAYIAANCVEVDA